MSTSLSDDIEPTCRSSLLLSPGVNDAACARPPLARRKTWSFAACLSCLVVMTLAGASVPVGRAGAPTPADELLRYVPADVGFCLVARDLRSHGQALAESPFVAGIRKTAAGAAIARADELARLEKLQEELQKQLGFDWNRLRDDIFGDAIAFAYRAGPPGKPEDEAGLILIRARAAKPLTELVGRLNEMQKASGEVTAIEERSHRGSKYFCRVERDKPPSFYCLRGPVLLLSANEALLLQALDLEGSTLPDAEPAVARELRLLGADRAVVAVWLNPRAFDRHIGEHARSAASDAAARKAVERYWAALDGAAFWLTLDKDLSLSAAIRGRPEQLPPAARQLFATASRPSDLWQAFPEPTLIAAAGRIDLAALVEIVSEFLPTEGRQEMTGGLNRSLGPPLGKDFVKEVLPCVGPDVGFCAYAPAAGDKTWCVQGFVAVKVAAGDSSAPVDRALLAGLHSVAIFAVFAHNSKEPDHALSLKTVTQDKREVHYLTGDGVFPPGIQPAFGLHRGYLVVATSPETLSRFAPAPAPEQQPSEPIPLLRVGLKEWREYLKAYEESLTSAIAEKDSLKPDVVRGRLELAISALELFDRLEVTHRSAPGQMTLTFRLQTSQPLKK